MIQLLILADDFTGALDTGIQFVEKGIPTQIDTGERLETIRILSDTEVLVLDLETRPLSVEKAGEKVSESVRWAKKQGIPRIYKKTDSALRGNIGSELEAVLKEFGRDRLYFIPAFPELGRFTKNGVQYLDGIPLSQTAFGRDLFEPITCPYIPDLIGAQSRVKVVSLNVGQKIPVMCEGEKVIYVCDAETDGDITERLEELKKENELSMLAGCAGCASHLPEYLGLHGNCQKSYFKTEKLIISCGSLNPITERQMDYLESKGILRIHLTAEQRMDYSYYDSEKGKAFLNYLERMCRTNKVIIIDTLERGAFKEFSEAQKSGMSKNEIRFAIVSSQGRIIKELIKRTDVNTILVTGGDTLMGFVKEIDGAQLVPICELNQGTVLSRIDMDGKPVQIISKSGGFGREELMEEIIEKIVLLKPL